MNARTQAERDVIAETFMLIGATLMGACAALAGVAALLRWLAQSFMVVVLVLVLVGCSPSPPRRHVFYVVVHNRTAQSEPMEVRGARSGVYVSPPVVAEVAGEDSTTFALGDAPDLVELSVPRAGWSLAWSGPEIRGSWVWHVYFPDGAIAKGWSQ